MRTPTTLRGRGSRALSAADAGRVLLVAALGLRCTGPVGPAPDPVGVDAGAEAASVDAPMFDVRDVGAADVVAGDRAAPDAPPGDAGAGFRVIYHARPGSRSELSSIAAADTICAAARPAGVASARALVVGATRRACVSEQCRAEGLAEHLDWPLHPNTEYRKTDRVTVVGRTNALGLFDSLEGSVLTISSTRAFTGLRVGSGWTTWQTSANCRDLTSRDAADMGTLGAPALLGYQFAFEEVPCDSDVQGVYCVEVP